MSKKITWDVIFRDFKKNNPEYAKRVWHWRPHDYATIVLYLNNRNKATYNYDTKEIHLLQEKWSGRDE